MVRRIVGVCVWMAAGLAVTAAGCTRSGDLRNPFVPEKPFVQSAVPADFAVVVDELHTTFYTRQHIQQVITAADGLSRTTYSRIRELTNTAAEPYSQQTELTASQVQAMWDAVQRGDLMAGGSRFWINWRADSDVYKENTYTIQIRANGQTSSYRQVNGFPARVRPLVLLVNAVRLPMSQDAQTPVVGGLRTEGAATREGEIPATMPAATVPASMPAAAP